MTPSSMHPGKFLQEKLNKMNMNATQLAKAVHVPANRITQIIAGKRAITADTALRLGKCLGISPHTWLKLQQMHELYMTRRKIGPVLDKINSREAENR